MKIALIGNDYVQQFPTKSYGGIEICVENLAWGLHKNNHDFFVIVPKRKIIDKYPFPIFETESSPSNESGQDATIFAHDCKEILLREKPDIIWSQSNWSADMLQDLNIPIICTFHDSCEKQYGWIKKFDNVLYRFISQYQLDNWITEEWEREKCFQCYTGIMEQEYKLGGHDSDAFIWVAGMQWGLKAKGLDLFVKLAEMNPNLRFIAYGSLHLSTIQFLYDAELKYKNFSYQGVLCRGESHNRIFSSAKGFIIPTQIMDTFPRTVLESLSKGTPVFGSLNGSISEMVEDAGFCSNDLTRISDSLYEKYNYKLIYDYSKRFHVDNEIKKMLEFSEKLC